MDSSEEKEGKKSEKEMSFLQHLEELRWHILRSLMALVAFAITAFCLKDFIFNKIILAPTRADFFTNRVFCQLGHYLMNNDSLCINAKPFNLISISMSGQLSTHVAVALVSGVILGFPYIMWEFWRFFAPALRSNEKKYVRGAVFSTSILFFIGVVFGYYMIVPFSISFLSSYQISEQVVNQINIRSYISTITSIVLASGLVFELPLIAFVLTKIGVVTPAFMKKYRRHAIVVIFIIGAIITPPDVVSQLLVSLPLVGLYEVGIIISKVVYKKRQKEREEFFNAD
jgi:sec-independent protein translocase protein TatC